MASTVECPVPEMVCLVRQTHLAGVLKFKAFVLKNSSWILIASVDAGRMLPDAAVAMKNFSFQSGSVKESAFQFLKASG
jgi:hypothetical protein